MPRLFSGIEIPPDVGLALSLHRGGLPGARWVDPANYHLTLRFFGDVDNAVARDLAEALDEVERPPFDLTIAGLDAFGGNRPRAIFADVVPCPALSELQAEHERIARRVGLPPERRNFAPHVTLARLGNVSARAVADWIALQGPGPRAVVAVSRFVLLSSRNSTGGGPYVVEAVYPLGGAYEDADADEEDLPAE